jgi:threonine synthase
MYHLGVIDRLPRLLGVQAAGVAPIAYALEHDQLPESEADAGTTLADGINVHVPRNWRKAVAAVRASNGTIIQVTDAQILAALAHAGRHGFFAEPAAAASVAGVAAAVNLGILQPADRLLALLTGSGLKDTDAAIQTTGRPIPLEPTLDAVAAALHK